jgi:WD40 repeat protein
VRIWDAASGEELLDVDNSASVTAVAYRPDGSALAIADEEGGVMLVDAGSGRVWRRIVHPGQRGWRSNAHVRDVAFSPDGTRLATAGTDGTARIWDVDTGENTLTIVCHENWSSHEDVDEFFAVAFSPDGLRLVTGTFCTTIRLWDARTGEEQFAMRAGRTVGAVAFSPDGTLVAATIRSGVGLLDASTGVQVRELSKYDDVSALAFSPDGSSLAVGSQGKIEVCRLSNGEPLWTVPYRGLASAQLAFSPDRRQLAGIARDDPIALLWEVPSGLEIGRYEGPDDEVLDSERTRFQPRDLKHLILSPDGELAAGLTDWIVRLWDVASGAQRHLLNLDQAHQVALVAGAFSPDGRLATAHVDGSIRVWDTGSGTCEGVLPAIDETIAAVAFSADGTELVAVGVNRHHDDDQPWGAVRVWDLRTEQSRLAHSIEDVAEQTACLASDGSVFALRLADGSVQVWDISTDQLRSTVDSSAPPDYWAEDRLLWKLHGFSPDGTRLAASDDGDFSTERRRGWVRVWDTTTGAVLFTVRCHLDRVTDVVFSSDNAMFATSCELDSTTRLWDGRTGAQLAGTDIPLA